MTSVTWIVEREVFAPQTFDAIVAHLRSREIPHRAVYVVGDEVDGRVPIVDGPCIAYGAIGVRELCARYGWIPGVFGADEDFNAETYADRLGVLMLNADAARMPLSAVRVWLAQRGGDSDSGFFLKPNADTKEFAGTTMTAARFPGWVENLKRSGYLENETFDVVISPARQLGLEWRVVVTDGEIVGASSYRRSGAPEEAAGCPPQVEAVVKAAQALFAPAPVYMIDVAEVLGEGAGTSLKVVEYNTFNSASLYACEVGPVIDAVTAYVTRSA